MSNMGWQHDDYAEEIRVHLQSQVAGIDHHLAILLGFDFSSSRSTLFRTLFAFLILLANSQKMGCVSSLLSCIFNCLLPIQT